MITEKNKLFLARFGKLDANDANTLLNDHKYTRHEVVEHLSDNPQLDRQFVRGKVFGDDAEITDLFKYHPSLTEEDHDEMIREHSIFPGFKHAKKSYIKNAEHIQNSFLNATHYSEREGLLDSLHSDDFPLSHDVAEKIIKNERHGLESLAARKTLPQHLKDKLWNTGSPTIKSFLIGHTSNQDHIEHMIKERPISHVQILYNPNTTHEQVKRLKSMYEHQPSDNQFVKNVRLAIEDKLKTIGSTK